MSATYKVPSSYRDPHLQSATTTGKSQGSNSTGFTKMYKRAIFLLVLLVLLVSAVLGILLYTLLTSNTEGQPGSSEVRDGESLVQVICQGPCNDSWIHFRGSCYLLDNFEATLAACVAHCDNLGAQLIEVDGEHENDFLKIAMVTANIPDIWLGVNDQEIEGKYALPSGEPTYFLNFDRNNFGWWSGDHEGCVFMTSQGTWDDIACDKQRYVACEKPID